MSDSAPFRQYLSDNDNELIIADPGSVVEGETFTLHPKDKANFGAMAAIVRRYLASHETVIICRTLAESAMPCGKQCPF